MIDKKINIYCSNSYEVLRKEFPMCKSNLLEYDSWENRPRGIKEICEHFMDLLNRDSETLEVWTVSDIAINIMGGLIAEGIFNYENVKLIFVGVDEDTKEVKRYDAGYTSEGFGNIYWPFGAMSSWYGFYKPGKDKLVEKSLKVEK
jgi:hypothetical protein